MSVDKPVSNFIINELTKAQFDGIDPSSTELYMVVDESAGVEIDNSTITENSSNQIQAVGVKDVKTAQANKFWTGTREEYESLETKDENTFYNVEDDYDLRLNILETLYPVGAIYIGTMSTCPLATLGVGTWQLVATDRVLQGAGTRGSVGTTVNESLPNITGNTITSTVSNSPEGGSAVHTNTVDGAFRKGNAFNSMNGGNAMTMTSYAGTFDASRCSSSYQNNAPVQQDAYLVNIWERIS